MNKFLNLMKMRYSSYFADIATFDRLLYLNTKAALTFGENDLSRYLPITKHMRSGILPLIIILQRGFQKISIIFRFPLKTLVYEL